MPSAKPTGAGRGARTLTSDQKNYLRAREAQATQLKENGKTEMAGKIMAKVRDWRSGKTAFPDYVNNPNFTPKTKRASSKKRQGHAEKVNPSWAREALRMAGGDRKSAFSRYIQLHHRATGQLAPEINARDLAAFYGS